MIESVLALVATTSLLLGSPGPAPLALAATGAAFGINRGIPFLFGILCGLLVVIGSAATGLATLLSAWPWVRLSIQILGAVYILYIAVKIATAPLLSPQQTSSSAPYFIDGFILNLLNPKAYASFFAIFSQFLLPFPEKITSFIVTAVVCFIVATVIDFAWLCLGGTLRPIFEKPWQARVMRISFSLLMVIAVGIVAFE